MQGRNLFRAATATAGAAPSTTNFPQVDDDRSGGGDGDGDGGSERPVDGDSAGERDDCRGATEYSFTSKRSGSITLQVI